jgi:hypothetical protein
MPRIVSRIKKILTIDIFWKEVMVQYIKVKIPAPDALKKLYKKEAQLWIKPIPSAKLRVVPFTIPIIFVRQVRFR